MPLGAISQQPIDQHAPSSPQGVSHGSHKFTCTNVTLSAAADYPTGGFAVTAVQLGLTTVLVAQAEQIAAATGAVTGGLGNVAYLPSTGKIMCFNNGGTEVAANTNLNGAQVQVWAFGY
jgi:hypothetical protein